VSGKTVVLPNATGAADPIRACTSLVRPLTPWLVRGPLAALGLFACLVRARAQGFAPGQIVDQVVTRADAKQSYALYLPSSYDPSRTWPVVFVCDPGARGRNAVERLRAAAERFGYVLAGSNNSRNGPIDPQYQAMVAMIGDLAQRLPLDPKRVYTAGMSGGARVALRTALVSGKIRGVLAFSAGLPGGMELPSKVPFAFFGTAGRTDMNYAELKRLDLDLEDKGATHRLAIFDGGHTWPPADVVMAGVSWLELEAMRGGVRPKDDTVVRPLWEERNALLPPATRVVDRWQAVQSLARDFHGLADVAAFEKEAKDLAASAEVKTWLRTDRRRIEREYDLLDGLDDAALAGDAAAMKKRVTGIRKLADAPADSDDRQLARRVLTVFSSSARELVRAYFQQEDYEDAEVFLSALVAFDPADSRAAYDLARARGHLDDRKGALAALAEAVTAGYTNTAQATAEPAFAKFKDDAGFRALLEKMQR
jgi:predicted esterase